MEIGPTIKSRRLALGLSLRSVAQKTGVDPAYLSRIEKGTVPASSPFLDKLAPTLELPTDELQLLAGRVPASLQALVESNPADVAAGISGLAGLLAAEPDAAYGVPILAGRGDTAIENGFPFETLSEVAEVESWRKEVYRPVYHQHKWWAQRLGSVFRAAILGSATPRGTAVMDLFYQPVKLPSPVVYDPFMGSGTTIGEAHKLGCTVIGRDINPVAYRAAMAALEPVDRSKLVALYNRLEEEVAPKITALYQARDSQGNACTTLYYFWVKVLPCPTCETSVDLFPSYVFGRHAYPKRHPTVRILCPSCSGVFDGRYGEKTSSCPHCEHTFNPLAGPAKRLKAECPSCSEQFAIAKTARSAGSPPKHRMYAKLVLRSDGTKEYLPITDEDQAAFNQAQEALDELAPRIPSSKFSTGHNTKQVMNYGYTSWDQMFNARQLLALSLLAQGISSLPAGAERDALMTLFSSVLEFNNMFASYKGEGTGAVRHMFSHHILKPERTPLEANVWGTPKSSGSFSTLFESRLLRAVGYKRAPFEVRAKRENGRLKGEKVFGLSRPMGASILPSMPEEGLPAGAVYLSCGDSSTTDLPDRCVDAIITDPPFFDNVHYSELADFFFAWQQIYFSDAHQHENRQTTRHDGEVQDANAEDFAAKLHGVFRECCRVLKDDGLLVFSYHHSRDDGWLSVAEAVVKAGFRFVAAQPVKSEMSVATPKTQAKSPIDLDVMLVCRKNMSDRRHRVVPEQAVRETIHKSAQKVSRFADCGRKLSLNDVRVIVLSQALVELSAGRDLDTLKDTFQTSLDTLNTAADQLWRSHEAPDVDEESLSQLTLI